jgi:DNA-binding NarL/FixJ family response regulator
MKRKRILVADDLALVLSAVSGLLHEPFDIVGTVSNGRAALKATLAVEPDLVVLDVSMPDMSGIAVARELRRRGSKVKIVFLTAYNDSEVLAICLSVGGLGYVMKELMGTDLIPAINEALAGRIFVSHLVSQQGAL